MQKIRVFILAMALLLLNTCNAYCYDDGFATVRAINGKYFSIFCSPQVDLSDLYQKLKISASDQMLVGKLNNSSSSPDARLADALDTLFLRASDILDMHLYSYHGTIKICRDKEQLDKIYSNLFPGSKLNADSFYVHDLNTIYISSEAFNRGVLGHEITHVITSHYFVVQPPVKVAEILSGYVEYQLRKTSAK